MSATLRVAPSAGLAPACRRRARTVCSAEPSRRVQATQLPRRAAPPAACAARAAGGAKARQHTRADTPAPPFGRLTRRRVAALRRARLWTPSSARPAAARVAQSLDANTPLLSISGPASTPVVARRGEEGPNPMVMERFQSVISNLFSQVRPARGPGHAQRRARSRPKT